MVWAGHSPWYSVHGPAKLGNTWPGLSSMVSQLHQWPKLNPVGFQEMPLMGVEINPQFL